MCRSKKLPTVAIVGKQNVGKSSLFNRLAEKRKAIISETPGVTRDINYEIISEDGLQYRLADTGGYIKKTSGVSALTQRLNQELIQQADIIIFMCEIKSLEIEDFETANMVRKSGKPCIFVINKVDNNRLLENYYDYFELGFENPIPISSIHGRNINQLKKRLSDMLEPIREQSAQGPEEPGPSPEVIHTAIVGKPNVGKSSLLNLLVEKDRSLVEETPGTTRDVVDETVEFDGWFINFIDTAGLRKKRRIRENIEFYSMLRTQKAIRRSQIAVLLIDATQGITKQDKKIAQTIMEEKKGVIIAANKWDLLIHERADEIEFIRKLYIDFPHISFAYVVPVSAIAAYNKIKLLKILLEVYNNYNRKIKTNELNNFIHSLSMRNVNMKYGYQKITAPPVFEFFIKKLGVPENNLIKYISNSLRKSFPFEGVPIEIILRKG